MSKLPITYIILAVMTFACTTVAVSKKGVQAYLYVQLYKKMPENSASGE